MNIKIKSLVFILITALLISMLPGISVPAAESPDDEFVLNGGFEVRNDDGTAPKWRFQQPENMTVDTGKAHSGSNSLKMFSGNAIYASTRFTHMVGGQKYKLSFFINVFKSEGKGPHFKLEYYKLNSEGKEEYLDEYHNEISVVKTKEWEKNTFDIIVPKEAYSANLLIRFDGSECEIYWDDISFKGKRLEGYVPETVQKDETKKAAEPVPVAAEIKYPYNEAEAKEFLKNGDFESAGTAGEGSIVNKWQNGKGYLGVDYFVEDKDVKEGKYALKLQGNGEYDLYVSQQIYAIVGEAQYKVSAYAKTKDVPEKTYPRVKFEFYSSDGFLGEAVVDFTEAKKDGKWEKWEFFVTAPKGASFANVLFRLPSKTGAIYYDSLSVKGADATKYPQEVDLSKLPVFEYKEMPTGSTELISNGSFEDPDEGSGAAGWTPYKEKWTENEFVSISNKRAHTGEKSVRISTYEGGNPWARIEVKVKPKYEYQLSMWISSSALFGNGASYKIEYYDGSGKSTGEQNGGRLKMPTGTAWHRLSETFVPPEGTETAKIYVRMYGGGEVFFDDVSVYRVSDPAVFELETDEVFYYTESVYGTATAVLNTEVYPQYKNNSVEFALSYNGTMIDSALSAISDGKANYKIYMSDMKEKQKEYKITAAIKDNSGKIIEEHEMGIYRYDRPTMLDDKGNFIVDGKILYPIYAYHVKTEQYQYMAEAGINVVQGSTTALDAAKSAGLKVIVMLYTNMQPAGHPLNAESTKETIKKYKDHPAVFGWAIMDEPFSQDPGCEPYLFNSYKIIRDIDPVHPVWVMQDGEASRDKAAKYCDILGYDPYPAGSKVPTTFVAQSTRSSVEATKGIKPSYCLLQAFKYNGYFPTQDDMRNMIYQTLFEGGASVGYYCFDGALDGKPLNSTELWPVICDWYKYEMRDCYDYFIHHKYLNFNELRTEGFWAESYVKDGSIYMVVLNRSNKEGVTAEIPLTSTNGKFTVGNFTASIEAGAAKTSFTGNKALSVKLDKSQAVVYKITPEGPIPENELSYSYYTDLTDHTWAKSAVETLTRDGILDGRSESIFFPAEKITRGDFAKYLVRTLGLKAETSENFADVRADAPYAKEIAAGKALGILNGIGDNKYDPESYISRQDLMTIISRAMNLKGDSQDLSSYSDNLLIADYALPHVKAMVASGIVKGNADGTINPLGNATRAETAVIMSRISN